MKILDFFKGLFRSRDKPQDSYHFSAAPFLFGKSISGATVNEMTAMRCSAVYACVRILAESVAALPLHVYEYTSKGKERAIKHPLYFLLHDAPNDEMTSFNFREVMMTHLLLHGNCYAYIQRDKSGTGRVAGLYPLMANRMSVERDDNRQIIYRYTPTKGEAQIKDSATVIYQQQEILHIPALGFDGMIGYSPIAMARNAIGVAIACEEFGAKFFENGARPSGILEHPGIIKNTDKLREEWQKIYGGSRNTGRVAILEEGMKYQSISIPPNDAQFLDTRKFQLNEIARIFRVPPHMLADLERATFSNIEHQSLEFVMYSLMPWLARWEQNLAKALFTASEHGKYFVKFNVDGLMRGDYQSRMQGYSIGRQNGWLSANDIREMEDLNPISEADGGNFYLVNGNFTKLKDAGAAYAKAGDKNG